MISQFDIMCIAFSIHDSLTHSLTHPQLEFQNQMSGELESLASKKIRLEEAEREIALIEREEREREYELRAMKDMIHNDAVNAAAIITQRVKGTALVWCGMVWHGVNR